MMVPRFDPSAPPFISIAQKGGGFGLRTRSAAAARDRIAAFLACGSVSEQIGADIAVVERSPNDVIRALFPTLTSSTWSASMSWREDIERHGHPLGEVATKLWHSSGPPTEARMVRDADNQMCLQWTWTGTREMYDGWATLAAQHTEMVRRDLPAVATTGTWDLRLRLRNGSTVDEPLPPSRFIPTFGGSHAAAYCYFVLPEMPLTPELTDEWDHLTARTGVKIPLSKFELCSPKGSGDGRSWRKLR